MKRIVGIFAVSFVTMMSVVPGYAEITSTELLNKRLRTDGNLALVAVTGSYDDLDDKPTLGDLAGKSEITNADVATNAAIAPTKIAIEKAATYEDLADGVKDERIPSVAVVEGIATSTAAAAVAGAVANVGKTYQVKSTAAYQMGGANGTWETMSQAQQDALNSGVTADVVSKANSALQSHQDISGKQDKNTAVTHAADTAVGDSSHPVYVNSTGAAIKIDKVAAASEADVATTATNAKKIPYGGENSNTFVSIWVEGE